MNEALLSLLPIIFLVLALLINGYGFFLSITRFIESIKEEKVWDETGRYPEKQKGFWPTLLAPTVRRTVWLTIAGAITAILFSVLSTMTGSLKGLRLCWSPVLLLLFIFTLDLYSSVKFLKKKGME